MNCASVRRLALISSILAVAAWLALHAAAPVLATTGPTKFLPPSHYKVASKVAQQYRGQYLFKSAAAPARISGGAMGIEVDSNGQLTGIAQFYGYDQAGHQTAWVGTLYNFHLTGKNIMIADIVGPSGTPLLARLFLTRSNKGDLTGQIELPTGRYAIAWQRLPKH
jgi:hypothetical protein